MKNRLTYLLKYSLLWLTFFIVSRVIFIAYNYSYSVKIPFNDLILTFLHGLRLDISMTGYILFFISFLMTFFVFVKNSIVKWILRVFTLMLITIFTLITIVDIELYRNWGFRIDSTILIYLQTPKESLASTPVSLMVLLFGLIAVVIWITFILYQKFVEKQLHLFNKVNWYYAPVFLIIAASMIIPIRGGFGIAPINQGTVYFSQYQYANHAALNGVWNFGQSVSTMNRKQDLSFMEKTAARSIFNNLYTKNSEDSFELLINTKQPNILIIILESFTGAVIEPLGGLKEVTPNINRLTKEGVLFTNFFASGDRSDKGIVSVLSGYPAQPTTSIIKYINKAAKLPHLSKELKKMGYSSGFYYGGEINFANMNSYFISGGYENLVTLKDFSEDDLNSKWGAHDHIVFNKLFNDLEQMESPFFRVMFTLSSHEPFDVPHTSIFNKNSEESKYLNSVHYTDSCVGDFISKAKQSNWWKNTWIIFVADHGSRFPGNIAYSTDKKFRIPMLWTGGAITTDTVIKKAASQIDIPLMIGNQLQQDFTGFSFSKDVLSNQKGFAFYAFNNGFGYFNDSLGFIWNNTSNSAIKDELNEEWKREGKAFMQILSSDFNSK